MIVTKTTRLVITMEESCVNALIKKHLQISDDDDDDTVIDWTISTSKGLQGVVTAFNREILEESERLIERRVSAQG